MARRSGPLGPSMASLYPRSGGPHAHGARVVWFVEVCELPRFANCKNRHCNTMEHLEATKLANLLISRAFHFSLGSASKIKQLVESTHSPCNSRVISVSCNARMGKIVLQHGVIPGSCHMKAQGISSPGTHEAMQLGRCHMSRLYGSTHRSLQDRFDTRRLAQNVLYVWGPIPGRTSSAHAFASTF